MLSWALLATCHVLADIYWMNKSINDGQRFWPWLWEAFLIYVAFKVLLLKSCLDKSRGRFLLWGGKIFSFAFYSLLIAKAILQWLISTFLPGLLNHPSPKQVWASFQNRVFPSSLTSQSATRKLCTPTPVWGTEWQGERSENKPTGPRWCICRMLLLSKHFLWITKTHA